MDRLILICITLLLTINISLGATSSIIIKVKKAIVYGQNIEGDFEGNLDEFTKSKYFEPEYAEGELEFLLNANKSYFKNAKNIARYAWKYLSSNVTVEAPYPCGLYYQGAIKETFTRNEEGIYTEYSIRGEGDGSFDSCSGSGGPGWWSYKVMVTLDPITSKGSIIYTLEEE